MMVDFTGKVVIETGAAGNLGQAVSSAFFTAGANLILVDRVPGRLERIYAPWVNSDRVQFVYPIDLTQSDQVDQLVNRVVQSHGKIDVLVNLAGGFGPTGPVHESPLDSWHKMMSINLHTALFASRAVAAEMVKQRSGKIINVGARVAIKAGPRIAAYSASKAAVMRLTESMSAELKMSGINVNCVVPGTIDAPANRESMPNVDKVKWVAPDALADIILFLASDTARAIHGAAIPVFGLG